MCGQRLPSSQVHTAPRLDDQLKHITCYTVLFVGLFNWPFCLQNRLGTSLFASIRLDPSSFLREWMVQVGTPATVVAIDPHLRKVVPTCRHHQKWMRDTHLQSHWPVINQKESKWSERMRKDIKCDLSRKWWRKNRQRPLVTSSSL